ncbi:hypothetical protein Ae168Ps1_6220c [Pseudonocardia sp. Ae168_Ps1]|nr:hypothetical protein Ae168Ps1_6220c [Pseudonocardia sp. Ae168_Ps1]OLL71593.1 hypothetical protein Ae263Ps1_6081c [Pseudonocardia sp. Ae263_Ps1]
MDPDPPTRSTGRRRAETRSTPEAGRLAFQVHLTADMPPLQSPENSWTT